MLNVCRPAELPVQRSGEVRTRHQPEAAKAEAAKALGVTIPQSFLLHADQVIELTAIIPAPTYILVRAAWIPTS